MANLIQVKRSTTSSAVPTLQPGEIGINIADGILYVGNSSGTPLKTSVKLGGSNTDVLFNDSGIANSTAGMTFDKATNTLAVANIVSVSASLTVGANSYVNTSAMAVGNSTINSVSSATSYIVANTGGSTQIFPCIGYFGANLSLNGLTPAVLVGANVTLGTASLFIGNSTVNASVTATTYALNGVNAASVYAHSTYTHAVFGGI